MNKSTERLDMSENEANRQTAVETTRRYLKQFWELIHSSIESSSKSTEKNPEPAQGPPKLESSPRLLKLLKTIPWILAGLFILSVFISLDGYSLTLFGTSYPLDNILRILSVSGLIGFLTNRLAIAMLFRPIQKRPLLGQGLIPAQKSRIAYRLATAVSEDLINPELIKQRIHSTNAISIYREQAVEGLKRVIDNPDFRYELKQLTVGYVEAMISDPEFRAGIAKKLILEMEQSLEERSLEKMAMKAYSYLRSNEIQNIIEKALTRIPNSVEKGLDRIDDMMDQLPDKLNAHGETIESVATNLLYKLINQLDVHELVEDNLNAYSEERLERMIKDASNEQLLYIQYLGGILGTVGGLVIWQPMLSLAGLTLIWLFIMIADWTIHYFMNSTHRRQQKI